VDYDIPEDLEGCEIKSIKLDDDKTGWAVLNANGQLIRQFIDHNGDGALDALSYYKAGIEVYRDIDSNFDKKFDQYRWLGTAGMRWGLDPDQDGKIDSWRSISAEEVSMEVVESVKTGDSGRFAALLIQDEEIESLGVDSGQRQEITRRVTGARQGFADFARSQKLIESDSSWIHFSGLLPGVIPAGTSGSQSDVTIYDSVAAVVNNGGRASGQLSIGTLIRVGDCWRVVDLPEPIVEGQPLTNGGLFFRSTAGSAVAMADEAGGAGVSTADQELFRQYEELDQKIRQARSNAELQTLHAQRAELFSRLVSAAATEENRSNWIRQMADMVTAAYLQSEYDKGIEFMQDFVKQLQDDKDVRPQDINYCQYRVINSFFSRKMSEATRDELEDIQDDYMEKLEQFVEVNPRDPNSADAMLQLALDDEAEGNINEADDWYQKIVSDFPSSSLVQRARGASLRLNCEGKAIPFRGQTLDGRNFNLSDRRGKVVLIQYWATWCEPCKSDLRLIKEAYEEYERRGFEVVSVSLDNDINDLKSYLRENPLPWVHLFAEGGLDSPLAEQLGVAMVPTMILVGADGEVVDRSLLAQDLDKLLSRELRSRQTRSRSARRDRK
jgi:thiol-disulfide isomerase/thioredoxin